MRNLKKFLALVLAMLMVVSAGAAVSAFDDVTDDSAYAAAIEDLAEKEIVRGKTADTFDPDANVTRWQMALFIVRAITGNTVDADWAEGFCFFDDIAAGQYPGAISKAAAAGIIMGRDEDTFDPTADVNFAEALTMAVRALGYEEKDKDGNVTFAYPNDYLAKAIDLGLTKNVNVTDKYQALTRAETVQIIYNMIYAERNGKDLTFAEEYFGEIGVSNANAYVLVATPKQAFPGFDVVDPDDEVVVLAKLDANGNFAGEMFVKLADLEIDYAEAEELFGSTVLLVNFNEKTEKFARCEFLDNDVVTNASVAAKTGEKITINGRTYYIVEDYSDTTIRNEIVIYDGSADMDIMTKADLTGNYQLVLADDDQNGIYDRAIFQPIYVSVFNAFDGEKDKTTGIWAADSKNTYTEDLAKGDVFTYTYNAKTLIVNVIDVLDYQEGVLSAVNATEVAKDNSWAVKVTIDGAVYTLSNANREAKGWTGANLVSGTFNCFANIFGQKSDTDTGAFTPAIGYTKNYLDLTLGKTVRFYAIGDQIIYAEDAYTAALATKLAVLKEFTTLDSDAIYADLYIGGKLVEDAEIVKFDGTDFSKLNPFALNQTFANIYSTVKPGTVLTLTVNVDGTYDAVQNTNNAYGLNVMANASGRYFKGGIADLYEDGKTPLTNNANAIRTNANTVFYFINTEAHTVSPFVGSPEDGSTIGANLAVFADKIGYGTNSNVNGVSGVIIVEYTNKDAESIKGFGGVINKIAPTTNILYVKTTGTITKVLGSSFGLTGSDANANYFCYTADELALNMNTGAVVKSIYVKAADRAAFEALFADNVKDFVKVDANNVVTAMKVAVESGNVNKVEDARNIIITIDKTPITVTKVISVKDSKLTESKTNYEWISNKENVYYVVNDKTLVVLVNSTPVAPVDPSAPVAKGVANATYAFANGTYGAIYEGTNGTGKITLYNDTVEINGKVYNQATGSATEATKYTAQVAKLNGVAFDTSVQNVDVKASFEKGVVTVEGFTVAGVPTIPVELGAGTWKIDLRISDVSGAGAAVVTYYVTIK